MKFFSILLRNPVYRVSRIQQDENAMRQSIGLEPLSELELENAHMKSGVWLEELKKTQRRYDND